MGVTVGEFVIVGVGVIVKVLVIVGVAVLVPVLVGVLVGPIGVGEIVGVAVSVGVRVGVVVGEDVGVEVTRGVGVLAMRAGLTGTEISLVQPTNKPIPANPVKTTPTNQIRHEFIFAP